MFFSVIIIERINEWRVEMVLVLLLRIKERLEFESNIIVIDVGTESHRQIDYLYNDCKYEIILLTLQRASLRETLL